MLPISDRALTMAASSRMSRSSLFAATPLALALTMPPVDQLEDIMDDLQTKCQHFLAQDIVALVVLAKLYVAGLMDFEKSRLSRRRQKLRRWRW